MQRYVSAHLVLAEVGVLEAFLQQRAICAEKQTRSSAAQVGMRGEPGGHHVLASSEMLTRGTARTAARTGALYSTPLPAVPAFVTEFAGVLVDKCLCH
jgi:hypothetical protein